MTARERLETLEAAIKALLETAETFADEQEEPPLKLVIAARLDAVGAAVAGLRVDVCAEPGCPETDALSPCLACGFLFCGAHSEHLTGFGPDPAGGTACFSCRPVPDPQEW